jgi:hypothetical protein
MIGKDVSGALVGLCCYGQIVLLMCGALFMLVTHARQKRGGNEE